MRKLLTLLAFSVLFTGCSDNDKDEWDDCGLWDFLVYNIAVSVSDGEGNDLLDPETPGHILAENIIVEYKSEVYNVETPTRAYPPTWQGLRKYYSEKTGRYYLLFGEFSPSGNYKKETFTIDWGGGKEDAVAFDMYITWHECEPMVHRKSYLNGDPVPGDKGPYTINIVK